MGQRLSVQGQRLSVQGQRLSVQGQRLSVQGQRFSVQGQRFSVQGQGFTSLWFIPVYYSPGPDLVCLDFFRSHAPPTAMSTYDSEFRVLR